MAERYRAQDDPERDAPLAWQVERDRFGLLFSGRPLGVGEMVEVVPLTAYREARDERDRLRAGIQWARGMCTDEEPHTTIDAFLAGLLDPPDDEGG